MIRTQNRRVTAAVAIVAALALAACGGDDDDDTDTTSSESAPETTADEPAETDGTAGTDGTTAESAPETTAGGDGETFEAEAYVDAMVVEIGLEDNDTTRCVAETVLDAIGVERVQASGVTPEELANTPTLEELDLAIDEANAESMQSDMEDCGDLVEMFVAADDLSDAQRDCAEEHLTTPIVAEVFVAQFVGLTPSAEATAATEDLQACAAEG